MSFSADTKAELCRVPLNKPCCAVAEATHVLHLGHHARFCGPVSEYRASELGKSFLAAAGVIHDEEYHACDCAQCRHAREVQN